MPRIEYEFPVNRRGDFLRVRITTERGAVVDFVVQYEALIDGRYRDVARYDASHGRAHRDLLDWAGNTIRKDWLHAGDDFGAAVDEAIADLTANWEHYLQGFLTMRPA